jgi:peptidoglycan/LPS O-acetylase OafA/YrhL
LLSGRESDTAAYRPDIDGLRAVAILLVIEYHAQPRLIPGGFIGVDIFFAISGFLITRIILTQLKAHTFSSIDFYSRRARRIFPALVVVLTVTYLIGWFVLLPNDFSLLGENIAAGVMFASNLFQLNQVGYFAPDSTQNPLLHLWSLGIEEQFYIFWPLLLLMISGSTRQRFWMAAIAIASFAVSLLIYFGYKEWSFYSPISRGWELLAGGIVASRYVERPEFKRETFAQPDDLSSTIGIVAIVGAAVCLNRDSLFPGLNALLPVLGAVLIIVSPHSWVNRILLSNRPVVLIGLISYPLYLWHWPLLSYLRIIRNGAPNAREIWAAVIIAFVLAWLTFRFVEIPLRRRRSVVPYLSFGLVTIGLVGILTANASGFGFRFPPEVREIAMIQPQDNAGLRNECFAEAPGARLGPNCIEAGDKPLLFLWGDSTAASLYPGLKHALQTEPFRLAHFAAPACMPILAAGSNCDPYNSAVFDFIKSSRPEIVLLHAVWGEHADLDKLRETIAQLRAAGIPRIVILESVPVWKRPLPQSLLNFYRLRHAIADRIATGMSGPESDQRMEAFSKTAGVEFVSARHVLCSSDGCLTRVGPRATDVITTDIVHLSDSGSKFLIERIGRSLFLRP